MFGIAFVLVTLTSSSPYIMFDKKVTEMDGKIGQDVNVIYTILNIGDSPATDLQITDSGIPRDQWEFTSDAADLKWSNLMPGENITHVFTVKPRISGNLRMGSSQLIYRDASEKKIAQSTSTFWFESRSSRSIGAKSNLGGYLLFIVASFIMIFIPFLIWFTSRKPISAEPKVKKN